MGQYEERMASIVKVALTGGQKSFCMSTTMRAGLKPMVVGISLLIAELILLSVTSTYIKRTCRKVELSSSAFPVPVFQT